jgi:DNA-binding winged helix-turn-helix (wHTH) protein
LKPDAEVTRFGDCALDAARRELRVAGEARHLSPRAFELLSVLLAERPRALSRDELRKRLWPDTYVSNTSLAQLVTEIRKATGDDPRQERVVRTVFGFGYAFAGEAVAETPESAPAGPGMRCWLRHGGRDLALAPGVNVLGRGPDAQVRLDDADVSRRHAAIVVEAGRATLQDLGSRNGTFVRGVRVAGRVALADGDDVQLGSLTLVFVAATGETTTHAARR